MMDGSGFDTRLVEFELDQARRQRRADAAERATSEPIRVPAAAWIPLFLWLTTTATAIIYFANA